MESEDRHSFRINNVNEFKFHNSFPKVACICSIKAKATSWVIVLAHDDDQIQSELAHRIQAIQVKQNLFWLHSNHQL